jgi:transcriptional regulator with XRE-family HTH domain/integrase
MDLRQMRYASVTTRHATAEDDRAPKTGSTGGTAKGSKRNSRPNMQLTLSTIETTVISAHTAGCAGPLPQGLRNRKSALHRAAQLLGMSSTQPANLLLGPNLESTITVIRGKGLEKKAASDLISHLRWWDKEITVRFPISAASGGHPQKRDTHIDRKFKNFLKERLKQQGLTYEHLAERSNVPPSTVYGWMRGKRPERTAHESLRAVAKVLQVSLADLMQFARKRMNYDVRGGEPNEYGKYLRERRQIKYVLRDSEVSMSLATEWEQFLMHQTKRSELERAPRSGWKQVHWPEDKRGTAKWFERYAGMYLPSANVFWRRTQQFLGWLRLPVQKGGFGLELSQCQTLAWLVHPRAVEAFVQWSEALAGGMNMGVRNFRQCVHSVAATRYGWLRQQPDKNKHVKLSRNPLRSIEGLRELDDPCGPVFDAVEELLVEADAFNDGSLASAIGYRDAALLAFLVLVPLRQNTLQQLTVGDRGNHIWFQGEEMYGFIPAELIKNGGELGDLEIRGLKSELTEAIRRYCESGRPRLVGASKTRLLFVSCRSDLQWDNASERVQHLTKRFLLKWVDGGLPMHTFRHLVATRFLKLHSGDYVGAAALLHDRLNTVLKTYTPKDPTGAFKKNAQRYIRRGGH